MNLMGLKALSKMMLMLEMAARLTRRTTPSCAQAVGALHQWH